MSLIFKGFQYLNMKMEVHTHIPYQLRKLIFKLFLSLKVEIRAKNTENRMHHFFFNIKNYLA